MAASRNFCVLAVVMAAAVFVSHGSPIKTNTNSEDNGGRSGDIYSEEENSRLFNDQYRTGYERAVYDLYTGRYHDLLNALPENTFAAPSKKAIDLGLGRFNAGSRAANSLMALDSARFAGGPGRK